MSEDSSLRAESAVEPSPCADPGATEPERPASGPAGMLTLAALHCVLRTSLQLWFQSAAGLNPGGGCESA